jgi:hypothetical protein
MNISSRHQQETTFHNCILCAQKWIKVEQKKRRSGNSFSGLKVNNDGNSSERHGGSLSSKYEGYFFYLLTSSFSDVKCGWKLEIQCLYLAGIQQPAKRIGGLIGINFCCYCLLCLLFGENTGMF